MTQAVDEPRTVREIVYGCMITLILCLSYCIRPNISSSSASSFHVMRRKLRIALWMVIAPELIVSWAFHQRLEGNKFARRFAARGWTSSHGQFLVMGGFMLYKDGQPFQVVSPEMFTNLLDSACIQFPSVSKEEIHEKSKAYPLFTAFTFFQTVWFIAQCIARRTQGLVITQLEMVTLSLVAMNILLLPFWWPKPLDTRTFVRIDLIRKPPQPNPIPPEDIRAATKLDFSREQSLEKRLKTVFNMETPFFAIKRRGPIRRVLGFWLRPFNLLGLMLKDYYGDLFLRPDKNIIPEGSTEVGIFYAPDTIDNLGGFLFTFQNILGSLFAAAHISMWYHQFPTYRDMMVWRIGSLFTVALPIVFIVGLIVLVAFYILALLLVPFAQVMLQAVQLVAAAGVILGFMGLLTARLALIVEAFVCLKSASGTALQAVSWTKYIPHFS